MEIKIKDQDQLIDATIEVVDGVMIVSPKGVKFEPKEGDICKSTSCVYIFKRVNNEKAVVYHCCLNLYQDELMVKQSVGVGYVDKYQRYATEEEKKKLFDRLEEEGLEWDADKKELVKLRWKPKFREKYYCPFFNVFKFKVHSFTWDGETYDLRMFGIGWVFRTKEECEQFCQRLNQAIKGVKP